MSLPNAIYVNVADHVYYFVATAFSWLENAPCHTAKTGVMNITMSSEFFAGLPSHWTYSTDVSTHTEHGLRNVMHNARFHGYISQHCYCCHFFLLCSSTFTAITQMYTVISSECKQITYMYTKNKSGLNSGVRRLSS